MGQVPLGVGKAHFQLSRHFFRLDKCEKIIPGSQSPGQHIKILILLHAGERGTHHIAGIISAAAQSHDPRIQGLLHDPACGVRPQVVELDGLAGGKMYPRYLIFFNSAGSKSQPFFRHHPGRHAQPQHVGFAALLSIASIVAGKAFVSSLIHLTGIECPCLFPKLFQVCFPDLGRDRCQIH